MERVHSNINYLYLFWPQLKPNKQNKYAEKQRNGNNVYRQLLGLCVLGKPTNFPLVRFILVFLILPTQLAMHKHVLCN